MAFEIARKIVSGVKAINPAGTPAKLIATVTPCFEVDVCADTGNTKAVVVGDANIDATPGAQVGTILVPGENVKMHVDDVSKIYADTQVNDERICFTYYVQ